MVHTAFVAYNEQLASRVRDVLSERVEAEKKMFGGLAFMVEGRMACCVSGDGLLVKVGREAFAGVVQHGSVEPMTMGEVVSDSWVRIGEVALADDWALRTWVDRGLKANPPKGET